MDPEVNADDEFIEAATIVQTGQETLGHRVLARAYADEMMALDESRHVAIARGGRLSNEQKKRSACVATEAEMARQLPGGSRVAQAPTEEFLEIALEHCAPGSTAARQVEIAVLLEEYARQLLANVAGTRASVAKPMHQETAERARRHRRLQRSLGVVKEEEEKGIFSSAEGV